MVRMSVLRFTKGQATGNDFVLVADPEGRLRPDAQTVRALCDRRFGVGADGFVRAVRSERIGEGRAVLAEEPGCEWFMDYRNADGSVAEMCGNGVRVFLAFLLAEGLVRPSEDETVPIGTRAGVRRAGPAPEGFRVDMGGWRIGGEPLVSAEGLDVPRPGLSVDTGNPHIVVALSGAAELAALDLSRPPATEPATPANVEFVVPADPLVQEGTGRIRMRVHERGAGETLSCGTGAVAAALAVRHWAGAGAPSRWRVSVPGGELLVEERAGRAWLAGPAELVFRGEIPLPPSAGPAA